jgi:hypothetical protein
VQVPPVVVTVQGLGLALIEPLAARAWPRPKVKTIKSSKTAREIRQKSIDGRRPRPLACTSALPVSARVRVLQSVNEHTHIDVPSLDTSGCIKTTPRDVQSPDDASSKQELEVRNCY